MDNNGQDRGAHAPNRGNRGGRVRGAGAQGTNTGRGGAAKAAPAKIGPTRVLDTEWMKENVLKDKSFVIWLGTGQPGDQQWTIHRPIGETRLHQRQWVATPTRDISFLLARKENEALAAWNRQRDLAKRRAVLAQGQGRRLQGPDNVEAWTFDGAPAIQPTIRACMIAAKAAGAKESEWLNYSDQAVQVAEQSFKQALKTVEVPAGWLRNNPRPAFETRGGSLGDVPQRAIGYLNGLSLQAARDKVTRVAIGVESPDLLPVPTDDVEESDDEDEDPAPHREEPVLRVQAPTRASPKGKAPATSRLDWAEEVSMASSSKRML